MLTLLYHKLKTFPLLLAVNQSEASRNCIRKIYHPWGNGYFAAACTLSCIFKHEKNQQYKGLNTDVTGFEKLFYIYTFQADTI